MHTVALTKRGQELAEGLPLQVRDTQQLYQSGWYAPDPERWTVGNDLVWLISGSYPRHSEPVKATSSDYTAQRDEAVHRLAQAGLRRSILEARVAFWNAAIEEYVDIDPLFIPLLMLEATEVLEALGSSRRVELVALIAALGRPEIGALATILQAPTASLYYHLVQLRAADIVQFERVDGAATYALNYHTFAALMWVLKEAPLDKLARDSGS